MESPPYVARPPRLFYGWYIVGAIMAIHWCISVTYFYGFQALFLPMLREFGWGRGVVSIGASVGVVLGSVLSPFVGRMVDRHGARSVLAGGVTLLGLGILSLAFVQNLGLYYLSLTLMSLGFSSTVGIPFSSAIIKWFRRLRGRALSLSVSGAVASGPFVVAMFELVERIGWRATALLAGLCTWLICIPLAVGVVRSSADDQGLRLDGDPDESITPNHAGRSTTQPISDVNVSQALKHRSFWLMVIIFGVLTVGFSSMMLHQAAYFISRGFSATEAATSIAYSTLLSIVGRLGTGWLMDKYDHRLALALVLACQCLAFLVMLVATAPWMLIIFGLFFGTAWGAYLPIRPLLVTALFGTQAYGAIEGALSLGMLPFAVVARPFLGFVFDQVGTYEPGIWTLVLLTSVAMPLCFLVRTEASARPVRNGGFGWRRSLAERRQAEPSPKSKGDVPSIDLT